MVASLVAPSAPYQPRARFLAPSPRHVALGARARAASNGPRFGRLIGTAPRQRFQQYTRHVHAFGTFISDEPLVAYSWLDAHDFVHPGLAPGA